MNKIKKDEFNAIDKTFYWYSIIGFVIGFPIILGDQLNVSFFGMDSGLGSISNLYSGFAMIYLHTFLYFPFCYCVYCLFNTYNKNINEVFKSFLFIINIIDTFLAVSTILISTPISFSLFEASDQLYYLVGSLFAIFPIITHLFYFDNKVNKTVIKRIITRAFMVLVAGLIIYEMTSCGSGIAG